MNSNIKKNIKHPKNNPNYVIIILSYDRNYFEIFYNKTNSLTSHTISFKKAPDFIKYFFLIKF